MKKAGTSFLALSALLAHSAASAADLRAAPAPPLAPATAYTWSGFYLGGTLGYGFGTTHFNAPGGFEFRGLGGEGWTGGLTGGFDYQVAPGIVLGLAADANLEGLETKLAFGGPVLTLKSDWSWALRGRLGYLLAPNRLIYATGGYTQMRSKFDARPAFAENDTRSGWIAGLGLETQLWGNWYSHAEYLYARYQQTTVPGAPVTVQPGAFISRLGLVYKFGAVGPAYEAPALVGRGDWTGFYVGVQAGYVEANSKITADPFLSIRGVASTGVAGGLVAGYDWQFAPAFVVGADADISAKSVESTVNFFGATARGKGEWDWSVRGRAGYLLTPGSMTYVTAGYAQNHVKLDLAPLVSWSNTASGLQFGAGAETMITPNVSLRVEYLETLYGKQTVLAPLTLKTTEGKARLGLTYKFGGDSAPALAKY